MDSCERVKQVCPTADSAYGRLKEKRIITTKVYITSGPGRRAGYKINFDMLLRLTSKTYGKIQTAELNVPPPPEPAIRKALVNSYLGLLACIHARYYCEQGLLNNEFATIVGPGGMGKSTYVWYLADMLGGILLTKEDDVLTAIWKLYVGRDWKPMIVLDDIAAIISKYWHLDRSERLWKNFFKAIEYAKDFTGVLVTTARSLDGQPKRFRELVSVIGEVKRFLVGSYIVDVIEWRRADTPRHHAPDYVDVLWPGLRLPEEYWEKMMQHRRIRGELLFLGSMLELAKQGELQLSDDELEKIVKRIQRLRERLKHLSMQSVKSTSSKGV